jgi:hypothetical protein
MRQLATLNGVTHSRSAPADRLPVFRTHRWPSHVSAPLEKLPNLSVVSRRRSLLWLLTRALPALVDPADQAQAPAVLDHARALPQGDGDAGSAFAGSVVGGKRNLVVLDAGDVLHDAFAIGGPDVDAEAEMIPRLHRHPPQPQSSPPPASPSRTLGSSSSVPAPHSRRRAIIAFSTEFPKAN